MDRTYDRTAAGAGLSVAGLFAGIGGIELGFQRAGHGSKLLCEIDPGARAVLDEHFPEVEKAADIRELQELPPVDLVAAGFPCQDLSQAGRTAGISGRNSGLVGEVFRLLRTMEREPCWLLLENVPFMLQLDRGQAMRYLTAMLDDLGYRWAYRVVDTRAFGLPQRRRRVLLLASRFEDPRPVLFGQDEGPPPDADPTEHACGFYWTEGLRGLGWAVDAIPTLKGGSTIGIPSAPAIRLQDRRIATPALADAERLQGFDPGWTAPALATSRRGHRWKLVGNAVSVPVAEWIGGRLYTDEMYDARLDEAVPLGSPWPDSGWSEGGTVFTPGVSTWPVRLPYCHLEDFLQFEAVPLSARATSGFLGRAARSSLRFPDGLLDDLAAHLESVEGLRLVA